MDPVVRVATPVRDQVVAALRTAILEFAFAPGQRLIERELVETFGVSRTTVREALGELKSEGLVTLVPQRGAIVAVPDPRDAADLYDVRYRLESLIVERFAMRATDAQLEALAHVVDVLSSAIEAGAPLHELLDARNAIFDVLMEGAASPVIQQITEGIQARVRVLRATAMADPQRLHDSIGEWRGLLAACRARDAALAASIYDDHLHKAADVALATFSQP